jgi:hypothetical protein
MLTLAPAWASVVVSVAHAGVTAGVVNTSARLAES